MDNMIPIQILATSDMHGWFVPHDFALDRESDEGGLTLLASQIRAHRAQNENLLLLDCGDAAQANYCEVLVDDEPHPIPAAFNALGYDLWTLGNHEYNFTLPRREKLARQFKGITLSGNVFREGEDRSVLPGTAVIERGGVRIGFVGMTTPLIASFEKGKPTLRGMRVENPLDVIGGAIRDLRGQGIDCLIGLIHEGLEEENAVYGSGLRDIARAFPEFDLLIGGHAHKKVACEYEGPVLMCSPSVNAKDMSVIDLTFEKTPEGIRLAEKSARSEACGKEADPELEALMAPFAAKLSAYVNTPVGTLKGAGLSRESEYPGLAGIYTGASGIMNLLAAACIWKTGAECVFLGTDYEDAGFGPGPVSIKDISSSYSYSSGEISLYPTTGRIVKKILEWSLGYFAKKEPGDTAPAYEPERRNSKYSSYFFGLGLGYTVDLRQEEGQRIGSLTLIEKDKLGLPLLNEDGSLKVRPLADDSPVLLGVSRYYMDKWLTSGCLKGETLRSIYSSKESIGDDGNVRAFTIEYIRDALGGVIDGPAFCYENWRLL